MKTITTLKQCAVAILLMGFMGTAIASDRYSTIAGIVATWEANLGPGEGWEAEFTAALNNASDAQLAKIQSSTNYDTVRAILLGGSVSSLEDVSGTEALGDLDQDLVYSPVFPCRIFDTRNIGGVGAGTPPVNDQTNDYYVYGDSATMTAQGGNPVGCDVPSGKGEPVGISVNMAAIPVSPAGHLRVYPYQGTLPTASFLNYFSAGNVANSGLITTCYLCPGTGQDISVFNRNSSHSFADVMGYFYPAIVPVTTYAIGDTGPAGGIVFYVTDGGLHGLEAPPVDQSSGAPWGCFGADIVGADGTAVGTGAQNTGDIVTGCMEAGIAARLTDNYWLNDYNDWFLPSKDELNLLWLQRTIVGGFVTNGTGYWSSSEFGSSVWYQSFGNNGTQGLNGAKLTGYRVRAIRAF